jgi:hypothetical protein
MLSNVRGGAGEREREREREKRGTINNTPINVLIPRYHPIPRALKGGGFVLYEINCLPPQQIL